MEKCPLIRYIEQAGARDRLYKVPYYATFNITTNAKEMLQNALEDLNTVSKSIRER